MEPFSREQRWLRELRLRAGPVGRPAPAWRVLRSDGFRSDPSASTVVGQADGAVRYSNFFSQATYSSIKAVAKDFVIEFGPADPTQLSHPRVSDYLGPKTAVKAFEANYDTSGAEEAFWSHLEEQKKALKANENFPFFSIVQSSGYGKSRLVKELQLQAEQKNKKLIYLSFASDKAYPHANVTVSNALKTQPRSRKVQAFVDLFHHALENPNQESYVLSHGGNDDSKMSPVEKNPQDIVFFIDEVFLAELNGLQSWATDISSAYLQAKTKEKLYVVAGPEFGDLEGHTLIVHKALYGLRTSGIRWHKRLADCLRHMGFVPCKGEPDIWMRDRKDHWEYIDICR